MGKDSKIAWTHHTFNPWVGCQRVSPGCMHCYAEAYDKRVGGVPKKQRANPEVPETRWGPSGRRTRTSASNWAEPLKWNRAAATAGERHRVFCSSLADVFEDRPELTAWRFDLLNLIRQTPSLDWLLLTKRPEKVLPALAHLAHGGGTSCDCDDDMTASGHSEFCEAAPTANMLLEWLNGTPPENVWVGTTVEDQQRANERIPHLLAVPAKVRFLSCEPLLERIDLDEWLKTQSTCSDCRSVHPGIRESCCGFCGNDSLITTWGAKQAQHLEDGSRYENGGPSSSEDGPQISWVIIGGESGPGARPFNVAWARDLLNQCMAAGVALFMKQLGARPINSVDADLCGRIGALEQLRESEPSLFRIELRDSHGGDPAEWPEDLRVREFP